MNVLVSGSSGFLGRKVTDHLLRDCHDVLCLDSARPRELPAPFVQCDLTRREEVKAALSGRSFDAAVHLAGVRGDPETMESLNAAGTGNLLEALAGSTGRAVVSSSCAVYGVPLKPSGKVTEDDPALPVGDYGRSMLEREKRAAAVADLCGMKLTSVRIFNLFGSDQEPVMLAPEAACRLAGIAAGREEPVLITGPLDTMRDMIDAEDAASAISLILQHETPPVLNLGTGAARSGREVVDALMDAFGIKVPVEVHSRSGKGIERIFADISLITAATGWKPVIPFAETIESIARYWLDRVRDLP